MWPDLKHELKKSYGTCPLKEWEARKDKRLTKDDVGNCDGLLSYQKGTSTLFLSFFLNMLFICALHTVKCTFQNLPNEITLTGRYLPYHPTFLYPKYPTTLTRRLTISCFN